LEAYLYYINIASGKYLIGT